MTEERPTRIYTRGGDRGRTTLADGRRAAKDCAAVEACGAVDELNCHVGLLAAQVPDDIAAFLRGVQRRLFDVGASACPVAGSAARPDARDVCGLESEIDRLAPRAGTAGGFVLPGGCPAAAQAHVCRAVCRRAERRAVSAQMDAALPYLNRLSDYFYVLSLYLNKFNGVDEIKRAE